MKFVYLPLELTGLSVISGDGMGGIETESDDVGDTSDSTELHNNFTVPYNLKSEVAVATQKTYILHMDASV